LRSADRNTLDILYRHRTIIADDAIIVFTDAYDVPCSRYDPAGLAADFSATGRDLLSVPKLYSATTVSMYFPSFCLTI
jgi:hypothetical protein